MINANKPMFRWGPIPGRLISISHWKYGWNVRYLSKKYNWPQVYVIFVNARMLVINNLEPLEKSGVSIFQDIFLKNKQNKCWKIWEKVIKNLFDFCNKLDSRQLKNFSNQKLESKWFEFNKLIYNFWKIGVIPEMAAYGAEPLLKNLLIQEGFDTKTVDEMSSTLSAPLQPSFYQAEEIDLLKLAQKLKHPNFSELLQKHQEKYYWLANSYYRTQVLHPTHFFNRVKEKIKLDYNLELKEISNHLSQIKSLKKVYLKKIKNKTVVKNIAAKLSYCIGWQDERKKFIFKYLHFLDLFIKEFARRNKLPVRSFDYAWPEEISVNVPKKYRRLWQKRAKNKFVVNFNNKKTISYLGVKANKIVKQFWEDNANPIGDEVKGLVICTSKNLIRGEVFVIKNFTDIKKFTTGKILVASMTSPDYIIAMRRAKAIITDTGGITCHAAIVARELKKVCIVGTRIATKVLKTGDMVEVDANKGIVRKLN